ncbi:MAG: cupin domain-containing protein [Chroococcidiopsis sp.]
MLQIKNYKSANQCEWKSMVGSQAIGLPLVKQDDFAADMISFRSLQETSLHTHPGDHILYITHGLGWLDYADQEYVLRQGDCYLVLGTIQHRIRASTDGLVLLSVSNKHFSVDSADRLEVIDA